jgi:hypothetical protein
MLNSLLPQRSDRTCFRKTAVKWFKHINSLPNPSPQLLVIINMIANAVRHNNKK